MDIDTDLIQHAYDASGNRVIKISAFYEAEEGQSGEYCYYLRDHLNSTRVVVKQDASVVRGYDYYPFGMVMREVHPYNDRIRFQFTGKERDEGSNYDYFGVRFYDSAVGRWMNVDPMEQYLSPYVYCGNDPINIIDKDGKVGFGVINSWRSQLEAGKRSGNKSKSPVKQAVATTVIAMKLPASKTPMGFVGIVGAILTQMGSDLLQAIGHEMAKKENLNNEDSGEDHSKDEDESESTEDEGETYSGNKTDEYGNELGPSGKPKVHVKRHSTRKGAKDAARNEGTGKPVKHPSPKKGNQHYHPTKKGKKIPNTHHEYPK